MKYKVPIIIFLSFGILSDKLLTPKIYTEDDGFWYNDEEISCFLEVLSEHFALDDLNQLRFPIKNLQDNSIFRIKAQTQQDLTGFSIVGFFFSCN